ncbi:MAG: tetratricopeptide repeat protein, partial [Gammaproteobacteria bacterium]
VKKHPAGGYANCIVGCSEKQPVARYMGFDLDEAYTEDQIKQFMCEKYNKPRPSWMSGHWIKQMPGVDSAVFNLTNFPEQITETEVPGILNQAMVLRLDFTKLLALISKPTATAKKFDVYLDVETKAISVLRQVDLNKSLTVEPIVSEDNIELHLQNAHYKNHSATLHCHNNAFELAIRDYQAALESYRLIYHYLESRHHIASLRVVEEQIALSCFKLASVMIRNNFFDKAIPYLKEAHEIWQHLLGEMHEKTKQAEERLAQIKLNSVRLAGGAEYLQFFNSNKNKFIPAPDTSKTNERSIVPHRKM